MKLSVSQKHIAVSVLALVVTTFSGATYAAVNAEAAAALAKTSGCLKCHALDKDKTASSFQKISLKWKGKTDAEAKLIDSLTKAPKVKALDGSEEEHKVIGTKDMNEIKNVIGWILSQ